MSAPTPDPRRHDLDALRASAMLLGVVYHAALSYALGLGWLVQDVSQNAGLYLFQAFVHGFRMPLFMLVSGFFTAMLWRKRGVKALLWHRFRRVLIPCLLGLVTVVPAMILASGYASATSAANRHAAAIRQTAANNLWVAVSKGDSAAVQQHLRNPSALTTQHPDFGVTPLSWAVLKGQKQIVTNLLESGAPVNALNRDGATALHCAAFLGYDDLFQLLVSKGAEINAKSGDGSTPLSSASSDFGIVQYIGAILDLPVDKDRIEKGRERVIKELVRLGANGASALAKPADRPSHATLGRIVQGLIDTPVFILVWFLWFLWWLVLAFSLYACVAARFGWKTWPSRWVLSPARLLWLIPLTLIPQWFMGFGLGEFGPDTSMGIIPLPHVFAYYLLFFFFGAFYFDCDDRAGRLGQSWRWSLPTAILVLLPAGLEFATGRFGLRNSLLPGNLHHHAAVFFEALYAWTMSIGCMGMFRALLTKENRMIRYLSDSAYWLYLAHLPLVIAAQAFISQWPQPALVKLALISISISAFLLLVYQKAIRYTWVGSLLNGPRKRPGANAAMAADAPVATG